MDPNQTQPPAQQPQVTPVVTEQNQVVSPTVSSAKSFPKIFIVIILVVALLSIGVGGYILGTSKTPSHQQFANTSISVSPAAPTSTPIPTITATQTPVSQTSGFIKRNFDPNVMYAGDSMLHTPDTKYPATITQQILSIPESQLIGLKCSQTYESDANGTYTYIDSISNKNMQVTDKSILQTLNKLQGIELASLKLNSKRARISYCDSENGKTFITYTTPLDNTNYSYISIPHLGIVDGSQTNVQQLAMDKNAAGDCNKFIQLTQNGDLYYRCETGESDTGVLRMYKEDVNKNVETILLDCTIITSVPAPSPPIVTCK